MRVSRAAIRYSKASLVNSIENKVADKVETDFRKVLSVIMGSKDLKDFLFNPVLPSQLKLKTLMKVFPNLNSETKSVISLLSENRRLDLLSMVAKNFIDSYQKIKGKITATVTSAVPLNNQVINEILDIAKKMTDLQVELKNNIDPKIIGGFILNVGDLQINASVANQLENLGSTLTKTNHIA